MRGTQPINKHQYTYIYIYITYLSSGSDQHLARGTPVAVLPMPPSAPEAGWTLTESASQSVRRRQQARLDERLLSIEGTLRDVAEGPTRVRDLHV